MEHVHGDLTPEQQGEVLNVRASLTAYLYRAEHPPLTPLFWSHWRSGYCSKELWEALRGTYPDVELTFILAQLNIAEHPWDYTGTESELRLAHGDR